jgi:hypothetical protein
MSLSITGTVGWLVRLMVPMVSHSAPLVPAFGAWHNLAHSGGHIACYPASMIRKPRRAPFVVTIALAAAAGACGGSTSGDDNGGSGGTGGTGATGGGTTGGSGGSGGGTLGGSGGIGGISDGGSPNFGGCGANPPSIPCPETPPEVGSACPDGPGGCFGSWWGTSCYYPDPCGSTEQLVYDCGGTTWQFQSGPTVAPMCPASPPADGDPCSACNLPQCTWGDCASSTGATTASCINGAWSVATLACVDAGTP